MLRRLLDRLLVDRRTGRRVVAQAPNLRLWTFFAAALVRSVAEPAGTAGTVVDVVAGGALAAWAADEVVRGVNPFRRLLGAAVLVVQVLGVLR